MALDTNQPAYEAEEKDLYEVGEMPPMGYVPPKMYAWAIRRERHGEPEQSFQQDSEKTYSPGNLRFTMKLFIKTNSKQTGEN